MTPQTHPPHSSANLKNILSKSVSRGKFFFRLETFIKEPKGWEEKGRALEGTQVKPTRVTISDITTPKSPSRPWTSGWEAFWTLLQQSMGLLHWDSSIGVVEQILERKVMARVSLVVVRNMLGVLDGWLLEGELLGQLDQRKGFGWSLYGNPFLNEKKDKWTGSGRNVFYRAGRNQSMNVAPRSVSCMHAAWCPGMLWDHLVVPVS